MQENPLISVITPSFNQAAFIERTILSLQNQAGDVPFEQIIVDGGSTDGTLEILDRYKDTVRYISGPDLGMQDALNKGFAMARGEILGWINSDDTSLPGALKKAADYFQQHPDCLWIYGNCRMIGESDREVRKWITAYKNMLSAKYSFHKLLNQNFISQPAVFMRRGAFEKAGPIDLTLPTAMDYDLWLRLARLGDPGYISDDLACFRVHRQSISAQNYRQQFEEQYNIHKRYDTDRRRLFRHRITIRMIVFVYTILDKIR